MYSFFSFVQILFKFHFYWSKISKDAFFGQPPEHMICFEANKGLWDLQIIPFLFTQHSNFFWNWGCGSYFGHSLFTVAVLQVYAFCFGNHLEKHVVWADSEVRDMLCWLAGVSGGMMANCHTSTSSKQPFHKIGFSSFNNRQVIMLLL